MFENFLVPAVLLIIAIVVIRWYQKERHARHLATVEVVTVPDFASAYLGNTRPLYIYLPPGYHAATQAYKTLYLNDGQDREALKLRETLATLYARQQIEPIVVVAIPTNEERLQEYGTAVAANSRGLGDKAADYGRFVVEEVMPYVKQNYRVQEAENTAVLGASLGGLSAFDIAWNYPDNFGIVGVMSGSFWWRAEGLETEENGDGRIAHALVRTGPKREGQRFWFQAATQDEFSDRDENGVIDAIQDTHELIDELVTLGYKRGKDVVYVEVRGGRHNYHTWANVLPQFLQWAFPRSRSA
jgi:enterochelin esterase-like enzyme